MATAAPGRAHEIVLYDPDINYDALPRIVRALNDYLAASLPGYKLRAVNDSAAFIEAVQATGTGYALVASETLDRLQKMGATPLLVPEVGGTVFYHKVLVDSSKGPVTLKKRRLAVATGDRGGTDSSRKILAPLRDSGLDVQGTSVVVTTKDFDALLGLTFGQADAALVTSDSIDLLKNAIPAAVASLRILWTSGNIMRPVLVAMKGYGGTELMMSFANIMQSPAGRSAMESLGFERWVPYAADTSAEGKGP